jgi:hypothetical protein
MPRRTLHDAQQALSPELRTLTDAQIGFQHSPDSCPWKRQFHKSWVDKYRLRTQ